MRITTFGAVCFSLGLAGAFHLSAPAQPAVLTADPLGNPGGVTVIYSEPMDAGSAQALGNYALANAAGTTVPITSATLAANLTNVFLLLGSQLQMTSNYTVTISNVKNQGLVNISPNPTRVSFWYGGNPNGVSFDFDSGQVPTGTRLAVGPDGAGNQVNPYQRVTNVGGYTNSGCLILANPASGQTFGQWRLTNDFSGGIPVTNLQMTFKLFMGNGSGGSAPPGLPYGGGNGMVIHWGPGLLEQYSGGASCFGYGLDLTFRSYNSAPNIYGVNVYYGGTAGAGNNTPIVNVPYMGYFNTNGPLGTFAEAVDVSLSISNGLLNLTVTPTNGVATNVFSNYAIPGFVPQPMGGNNFAFTTTDGSGAHESCWLDSVDLYVNGGHVPPGGQIVGPVGITVQPASITTNETVEVVFNVGVTGAPPILYQWYSNSVPIPGATAASYKTPLTLYNTMNGTHYSVAVSNDFSFALSTDAVLTLIRDTNGTQVASVGSVNGSSVGVLFTAYVDPATAGNPANYLINGVQPTAATVRTAFANLGDYVPTANPLTAYAPAYLKTVRLTPAAPVTSGYQVTVKPGVLSLTGLPVAQTNLIGTVLGMADAGLQAGGDPVATGEAFSVGTGQVELIAGGGDFLPIAASSADRGHFAYVTRTGNFDMVAKLTWETPTMAGAKAGMLVRSFIGNSDPSDPSEPTIAMTVFPSAGRNAYETGARLTYGDRGVSWAAPGVAANGNVAASWSSGGNWIRIRRLGPYFMGYASANASDGTPASWTLVGLTNVDVYMFPEQEWVGLVATAANNDGRLSEADFSNWGPMTFSTATVTITNNLRTTPAYVGYENSMFTFTIGATVTNAPLAEVVYQWQRKGPADTAFADILDGTGNTNFYTTPRLTVASDNGAQYRCIAFVGDLTTGHGATSAVATLSVLVDTTAPYMTAAAADSTFRQLTITFDGPMDYSSLADPSHYTLVPAAGGSAIPITQPPTPRQNADFTYSSVVVVLDAALSPGVKYLLTVANLFDSAGNNISQTTVPGGRQRTVTGWMVAAGYLKYERWTWPSAGITDVGMMLVPGSRMLVDPPDVTQLTSYSGYPNGDITAPTVSISDFGARVSGLFIPPANGNYQWYIRGNDGCAIWVSSDNTIPDPTTTTHKAAYNHGGGFAAPGGSWAGSQTNLADISVYSAFAEPSPIPMVAGQMYGLTVCEKQGTGTSFLEFTYGTDGATVKDGSSITNTPGGAAPTNGRGGAATNTYNITGASIATYVNPDASVITATGPTNTVVEQGRSATFQVAATAVLSAGGTPSSVTVSYQWMKNGANIAGATASSYTTPAAIYPGDNGATFAVVLSVANLGFMTLTNSAVLTVTADTNAPVVLSSSSYGRRTIGIRYDWYMDAASAGTAANYSAVSGGLTVTSAQLRPDGQTVMLQLSGPLSGPTFSVTLNNVKDATGNSIAPNTVVSGKVLYPEMTAVDIGVATNALGYVVQTNSTALTNVTFDLSYPGSTVSAVDGVFEVQASGRDLGNNQDGLQFVCEPRSGDFDVAVRVDGLTAANNASKVGLMLRENLTPGSRRYNVVADPPKTATAADGSGLGLNKVEVTMRTAAEGASATWGNNSAPANLGTGSSATQVPGIWLRLKLVGRKLYAYTGADGTNWALAARENLASSWPLTNFYVGMCVTSRTNSIYTAAKLSSYGNYTAPSNKRALFLIGDEMNVPAGAPNATPVNAGTATPQQASDTRAWNTLIGMGYNVTATRNETFQPEDTEGVSVVLWSSTGNSGGTGNPSSLTTIPVPLIVWESSAWGKLKMASADGGNSGTATQITITNTAPPTASVLSAGLNGTTTVFGTADINSRASKSTLGSGAVMVAQQASDASYAVIWGYEKGATMSGINAPHRRLSIFVNDTGLANLNANGYLLFTNAIAWASVKNDEAPNILSQPADLTVPAGSPATFLVTAGGGSGPYSYQWAKMVGVTPVDIPGAINRDYSIPATALADAGGYLVKITALGSGLSVTSTVANLTVINTAPAPVAYGLSGNSLSLSWPSDHLGWRLVVQTNSLTGTWYTVTGSMGQTSVSIPIDRTGPPVFYRLVYP